MVVVRHSGVSVELGVSGILGVLFSVLVVVIMSALWVGNFWAPPGERESRGKKGCLREDPSWAEARLVDWEILVGKNL